MVSPPCFANSTPVCLVLTCLEWPSSWGWIASFKLMWKRGPRLRAVTFYRSTTNSAEFFFLAIRLCRFGIFLPVNIALPWGKVVAYLPAIGKSIDFMVFDMPPNYFLFCRKVFNGHAFPKVSQGVSSYLLVNRVTQSDAMSIVASYVSFLCWQSDGRPFFHRLQFAREPYF